MKKFTVFLDTNSIIANGFSISKTATIRPFVENGLNNLIISSVVKDEVVKNYNKRQIAAKQKFESSLEDYKKFGYEFVLDLKNKKEFEADFSSELSSLSVTVLGLEYVDVDFTLKKAMDLKKPFKMAKKDGKMKEAGGIKDAYIWSSFITFFREVNLQENEKIVFVTKDSDFVDKDGNFHEDLIDDLVSFGIPTDEIIIVESINDLNEKIIQPTLPKLQEFYKGIQTEIQETFKYKELDLEVIVEDNRSNIEYEFMNMVTLLVGEDSDPEINLEDNYKFEIKDSIKLLGDSLGYLNFTLTLSGDFTYFIPQSDYYMYHDIRAINMIDDEWNEYVFWVGENREVVVPFEVTFNLHTGEIGESRMINDIKFIENFQSFDGRKMVEFDN